MQGVVKTERGQANVVLVDSRNGQRTGARVIPEGKASAFQITEHQHMEVSGDGEMSISVHQDAKNGVRLVRRDVRTGQDDAENTKDLAAGEEQDFGLEDDGPHVIMVLPEAGEVDHVLNGTIGEPTDVEAAEKEAEGEVEDEEITLTDASDEDVKAAIADLAADQANLTSTGVVDSVKLNSAMKAKGFNPVTAARRDAVAKA